MGVRFHTPPPPALVGWVLAQAFCLPFEFWFDLEHLPALVLQVECLPFYFSSSHACMIVQLKVQVVSFEVNVTTGRVRGWVSDVTDVSQSVLCTASFCGQQSHFLLHSVLKRRLYILNKNWWMHFHSNCPTQVLYIFWVNCSFMPSNSWAVLLF